MGAEDKNINNVNPEFRGKVVINDVTLNVINACVFNGVLHFGLCGYEPVHGEAAVGWIPAFLCEIV